MQPPGPKPVGDPAAVRAKATSLRAQSAVLVVSFVMLGGGASTVEFQAPAGDRWRDEVSDAEDSARDYARQAEHLADRLDRAANDLEDDLHDWGVASDRYAHWRREQSTKGAHR